VSGFLRNENGAAAIEFGLTAPLMILAALAGMVIGLAVWQWNSLQTVAAETARCVALNSTLCQTVDAGTSYAVDRAKGLSFDNGISGSDIAINGNDSIDGVAVTTVSIRHPFALLSSSFTLKAKASFPNSGNAAAPPPPQPLPPIPLPP